jgi:hypothetical protein
VEVGDGIIRHDDCVLPNCAPGAHNFAAADRVVPSLDKDRNTILLMSDLRDIRLNLHHIGVVGPVMEIPLSASVVLGRTLLHLADVYTVATFCVYPISQTWGSSMATLHGSNDFRVIYLRIIGRNCWVVDKNQDYARDALRAMDWRGQYR